MKQINLYGLIMREVLNPCENSAMSSLQYEIRNQVETTLWIPIRNLCYNQMKSVRNQVQYEMRNDETN